MSVGTAVAIAGIGTSIASGVIGSNAAKSAAKTQAGTAAQIAQEAKDAAGTATTTVNNAGTASVKAVNDATTTANQTLTDAQAQQLKALQPYIDSGAISLTQLQQLLSPDGPLGSKNNFSFSPQDWQNDPGYQFIQQQQQQAQERSAAANGSLLTGGFAKALNRNASGYASSYLDSAFNRALQTYQTNRAGTLAQIQGLQNLTGLGYNATASGNQDIQADQGQIAQNTVGAGQYAGNTGLTVAQYAGNAGLTAAQIAAQAEGTGAAATAAGTVGAANAWSGALNGVGKAAQNGLLLYKPPTATPPSGAGVGNNGIGFNPAGLTPPTP